MSSETLAPDAILVQTLLDGAVTDIDEDPASPDGAWLTYNAASSNNTDCRVSFPTPSGAPNTGAGLQTFRVRIRKNSSAGNATTWSLALWESGAQVAVLATGTTTALNPGEVVSGSWDASVLGDASGAGVECRLEQTGGGSSGSGAARRRIELGAFAWDADYTASEPPNDILGQSDGVTTVAATLAGTGSISGTSAGVTTITGAFVAPVPVDGQSDGLGTASAAITGVGSVVGESAGAGDLVAAIIGIGSIAATADGQSTVTGAITGGADDAVSGVSDGTSVVTSELSGIGSIAGQSEGAGSVTGAISGESTAAMSGVAVGDSTAAGSLFGFGRIWGICEGVSSAAAVISDGSEAPIKGRHRSALRIGIR
jgi:hypothetical protein